MKMALPVVPLQSLWHSTPKPPPSKTEGGAPPSHHSPINYRSGILPSHAALKRKERTAPPGHPSLVKKTEDIVPGRLRGKIPPLFSMLLEQRIFWTLFGLGLCYLGLYSDV